MSYILPNSDVHILKNVPLDKSYNHTLLQENLTAQYNTFIGYRKYSFTAQSYQRSGKGMIRIGTLADNLYDCNYMMFKNTSYGAKWFYAFIDSVDYINDNACEVHYTIDVMQTWYFDYELGSCFVAREHTLTDNIGDNLVPEKVDIGELIPMQKVSFCYPQDSGSSGIMYMYVVFYVPNNDNQYIASYTQDVQTGLFVYHLQDCRDADGNLRTGSLVNGIYSGCTYFGIPMKVANSTQIEATRKNISKLIDTIIGDDVKGTIANACQVPYDLWQVWISDPTHAIQEKTITQTNRFYNATGTDYYTAKNKKLLTAPYRSIIVSNNAGQSTNYNWEYFNYNTILGYKVAHFYIEGVPLMQPEILCYPRLYRNLTVDYDSGIVLNDFPSPPWNEDSFSKWWAENKNAYVTSLVSTAIFTIGSIILAASTYGSSTALEVGASLGMSGTAVATTGTAVGGGMKIANKIASYSTVKNTPDQLSGQTAISSLRTVQQRIGFYFYDMGMEYQKAQIVDNYFSMFGYAINRVKIPNVRTPNVTLRPHWNYVQTISCIIHSATDKGLPADDEEAISKIYDNGITFWTEPTEVGDYSLDNSPVT